MAKLREPPTAKALANLKPPLPGERRNPNGRPKGSRSVSTVLKAMLDDTVPNHAISKDFIRGYAKGIKRVTNADAIACQLLYQSITKGDLPAIKEVLDRTEGKPKQAVEVTDNTDVSRLADELIKRLIQYGYDQQRAAIEVKKLYPELGDGNGANHRS